MVYVNINKPSIEVSRRLIFASTLKIEQHLKKKALKIFLEALRKDANRLERNKTGKERISQGESKLKANEKPETAGNRRLKKFVSGKALIWCWAVASGKTA